jgi:hypothetical protein
MSTATTRRPGRPATGPSGRRMAFRVPYDLAATLTESVDRGAAKTLTARMVELMRLGLAAEQAQTEATAMSA